jgi:hypothetical protein
MVFLINCFDFIRVWIRVGTKQGRIQSVFQVQQNHGQTCKLEVLYFILSRYRQNVFIILIFSQTFATINQ